MKTLLPLALASTLTTFAAAQQALQLDNVVTSPFGYVSVPDEQLEDDYIAVGAEFRNAFGDVQGAISVGGPRGRFPKARIRSIGELLRSEADALSRRQERERVTRARTRRAGRWR
ncbi:MAG: hypothetical protein GY711_25700 [bacterium]|nr:hypothetical protein [bacterium]